MSDVIKDGEHWWCALFEKPDEAALWAGSIINTLSGRTVMPQIKCSGGGSDDLPDVPLSERGFGV